MKHIFATGVLALLSANTIAMEALPYQIECTATKGFETRLRPLDGRPEADMEIYSMGKYKYDTTIWRMMDGEYRWIDPRDKDKRTEELLSEDIGMTIAHEALRDGTGRSVPLTDYPSLQLTVSGISSASEKWVIRLEDRKFLRSKQSYTMIEVQEGRCIFRGKPD